MSQKNVPKEKRIPRTKIKEGIDFSLKKSLEHLDGAETLIGKNLLNDSVALIEFAIEEFGRAVILRNMFRNNLETIAEKSKWKSHNHKYEQAFTVLSENLKIIWEETFGIATVGASRSTIGKGRGNPTMGAGRATVGRSYGLKTRREMVSDITRCNAIFVDFIEDGQTWQTGIKASIKKLKYIIAELRKNIKSFTV
jgi:AbiV family abortive infection protein